MPLRTTELGYVDPVDDHERWSKDIEETQGHAVSYPLIGDPELRVAKVYFDEVLRVPDSIQPTARHPIAAPVSWKPGENVIRKEPCP